MNAVRILHVISSLSPKRGGPSMALQGIAEALRSRGIHADIVTTDDDGPNERYANKQADFVDFHGQRVRYFPRQTRFYNVSLPMLRWLIANVRKYDVVHTHCLYSFAPVAAAAIARISRVPYVMLTHGMLDRWGLANRRPTLKRASIRWVEGPLLSGAAGVQFFSEHERLQAQETGLPMRPLLLPLGLDLRVSSGAGNVDRRADTILYLSRIDRMKGIDALLQAFAKLAQARSTLRLIIAGSGEPDLVHGFQQLARNLGLESRIEWPGFVQGELKARLLRASTLFVLPSRSENFGIAIAEAMAAGLPVVIADGIGMAHLVRSTGSGLVTDGTASSIESAITLLLDDAGKRAAMGAAGREAVEKHLSLDAFGTQLEDFYRSVAR